MCGTKQQEELEIIANARRRMEPSPKNAFMVKAAENRLFFGHVRKDHVRDCTA